jgi:hypothetical protein
MFAAENGGVNLEASPYQPSCDWSPALTNANEEVLGRPCLNGSVFGM